MAKISFKPGNMLYPLPVVMVSVADKAGKANIITVAWLGLYAPIRLWSVFLCGRQDIRIICFWRRVSL